MATRSSVTDVMSLRKGDSTVAGHSVSVIILEPSHLLSHERLQQLVASSLPRLARFRSRLVGKPLGAGQPLWAEINDYDPTSQIHGATLPAPGGRRELGDLIAQLSAGRHDRRTTLWEAWSIDGLAGGRWALAVKISPELEDTSSGLQSVWSHLLNSGPHHNRAEDEAAQVSLGASPSFGELITDTMSEMFENQVEGLWLIAEAVAGVLLGVRRRLLGLTERDSTPRAVPSMSGPLPHNVFNAPLSARRTVAFASIPRADLETVRNAFGGNIANVFLAACTLSLRDWLQRHDTVPADPLLMQMPLALPGTDPTTPANPLAVGRVRLPVQLDDPVQVLTNLHTASERLYIAHSNDGEKSSSKTDLARWTSLVPPSLVHAGMRLYTGLGLRQWLEQICHGTIAYFSGEAVPVYCAGAKVVGMHTVSPLSAGCGLNITLTSRGDIMDLTVCVCPDNVPAVDEIATAIVDSVDLLVEAARKSPRGHGRSVVTEMTSHTAQR